MKPLLFLFVLILPVRAAEPQNPSPMVEHTREHPRLKEEHPVGKRVKLDTGTLFIPQGIADHKEAPLLIFMHGGTWIPEVAAAKHGMAAFVIQRGKERFVSAHRLGRKLRAGSCGPASCAARLAGDAEARALTLSRLRSRKPFRVLVALAAEVGDALAAQKGEVALHAAVHRADSEISPSLTILLAVEDVGAQDGGIKFGGDGWQIFERDRCAHDSTFAAVKGLSQGEVIDVIKLHACLDEHPDDLREGLFGMERGMDDGGDELCVHGG